MPTYQYACTACEHRFEAVQSFSDASLTECPECAGKLRKLFGAVGVVFKGSGFYRTDSRSSSKSPASTGSSATESKPAAAKTESKPKSETKSESKSAPAAKAS
ncbi:FmdB family transcriptional regulator [Lentzea tibetensis]|uniref:FmdB family transcriptional regulator n=1 Tax=Lentzea tibetensis TaxID=2591470 RepID=A0A563EQP1_9PSEU|nr:FmdB family zinc ribbon protein [Lentzea tibetensis]TWP49922.1 FmdB family transcriptional regulator [Lentzea tibetensis]